VVDRVVSCCGVEVSFSDSVALCEKESCDEASFLVMGFFPDSGNLSVRFV
jgi:hypothetical protein